MMTNVWVRRALAGAIVSMNWLSAACANDTGQDIKVASVATPYTYQENGSGIYNRVFDRLIEGYPGTIQTIFYPSARYHNVMVGRAVDCNYTATNELSRWQAQGIQPSELEFIGPINSLSVVLYVPAHADDVDTVSGIKNLLVASDVNLLQTVHRYGIQETFALQDQRQMLRLLAIRRIEGLLGYDFDLDFLRDHMGLYKQLKKASVVLDTVDEGIICFNNEKTAAFREHLWSRLEEIKASGWLDETFSRHH